MAFLFKLTNNILVKQDGHSKVKSMLVLPEIYRLL